LVSLSNVSRVDGMEIKTIQWAGGLLVGGSAAYWTYQKGLLGVAPQDKKMAFMVGFGFGAITGVFVIPIVLLPLYMIGVMKI